MEEFSAECHSVDSSGDSKVLTELVSRYPEAGRCFQNTPYPAS